MSVGALIDTSLRDKLKTIAKENNACIHVPSGAIVGLDGVKAGSIGKIHKVSLTTRKPPKSLGISADSEIVLYEGKARDVAEKFPMNINVAATLSIACGKEVKVKIIADPGVDRNSHEVHMIGDFGELKQQPITCDAQ